MRTSRRPAHFWTALLLLVSMGALDFAPAIAGLAPSRASGTTAIGSTRDADMLLAQRALENKVVGQKLRDYGVAPADAQARLASMSDADLHTLATAAKGLPSGGDATGAVIGVLVVVILVIVILRLMHRDVVLR
ncbi:MAG: PA2779 family protein [Candidatus Eisenbacteria bacterium]